MPMTREQILTHAMTLGAAEREALAEELLQSISDGDRDAIDAAWLAEARSREEAFARGEMSTSPLGDVLARVRSKAPR